jgi:hypothetical protein
MVRASGRFITVLYEKINSSNKSNNCFVIMNYLSAAIHFLLLVAELILGLGCAVGNLRKEGGTLVTSNS